MRALLAATVTFFLLAAHVPAAQERPLEMSAAEYENRVGGAWLGQARSPVP